MEQKPETVEEYEALYGVQSESEVSDFTNILTAGDLYLKLYEDGEFKLTLNDDKRYHALRVALIREHAKMQAVENDPRSVQSSYDRKLGIATYKLAEKKAAYLYYRIIYPGEQSK